MTAARSGEHVVAFSVGLKRLAVEGDSSRCRGNDGDDSAAEHFLGLGACRKAGAAEYLSVDALTAGDGYVRRTGCGAVVEVDGAVNGVGERRGCVGSEHEETVLVGCDGQTVDVGRHCILLGADEAELEWRVVVGVELYGVLALAYLEARAGVVPVGLGHGSGAEVCGVVTVDVDDHACGVLKLLSLDKEHGRLLVNHADQSRGVGGRVGDVGDEPSVLRSDVNVGAVLGGLDRVLAGG